MAGHGPPPKPDAIRQRRGSGPREKILPIPAKPVCDRTPKLPRRERGSGAWRPEVLAWWEDLWKSPMAAEFIEADMAGLYLLADLYQHRWTLRDDPKTLVAVVTEIRLQESRFGLSPQDRRRLGWVIAKVEKPEPGRGRARRGGMENPRDILRSTDPRSAMRLVP